jgi:hypothetical protein
MALVWPVAVDMASPLDVMDDIPPTREPACGFSQSQRHSPKLTFAKDVGLE